MTAEKLQKIVGHIESIKFLLDERDLDSQALQVELAGLPPTKNLVQHRASRITPHATERSEVPARRGTHHEPHSRTPALFLILIPYQRGI